MPVLPVFWAIAALGFPTFPSICAYMHLHAPMWRHFPTSLPSTSSFCSVAGRGSRLHCWPSWKLDAGERQESTTPVPTDAPHQGWVQVHSGRTRPRQVWCDRLLASLTLASVSHWHLVLWSHWSLSKWDLKQIRASFSISSNYLDGMKIGRCFWFLFCREQHYCTVMPDRCKLITVILHLAG